MYTNFPPSKVVRTPSQDSRMEVDGQTHHTPPTLASTPPRSEGSGHQATLPPDPRSSRRDLPSVNAEGGSNPRKRAHQSPDTAPRRVVRPREQGQSQTTGPLHPGWTHELQHVLPSSQPAPAQDVEMHDHAPVDSASDTDGSDTDDEVNYKAHLEEPGVAAAEAQRNRNVASILVSPGYKKKLDEVSSGRADGESLDRTMFSKGERPTLKGGGPKQLYRKEAKLLHPTDKLQERTALAPPTANEKEDLKTLNDRLGQGQSLEEATRDLPHQTDFVVAQYRGMWYKPSTFGAEERRAHRDLDELNQPIFSQAALEQGEHGVSGYYQLYNDPTRKQELGDYQQQLEQYGAQVRDALKALESRPVTDEIKQSVTRPGGDWRPQTLQDVSVHFYSEDYDGFHRALEGAIQRRGRQDAQAHPADALFEGLPNSANPKVSTGDVPVHANKYSLGLKPYSGHEQDVLEPAYNATGKPKRPYSGKVYTSIHPVTDYDTQKGPTQLVPLQNQKRINISKMIIPERETQFDGMMPADRVAAQRKAKFPNFEKDYKAVHARKYGMGQDVFQAFSRAFKSTQPGSDERTYVESLLTSYLSRYADVRSVEQAQELARERGARLVYRTGPKEFGFEPPKIL